MGSVGVIGIGCSTFVCWLRLLFRQVGGPSAELALLFGGWLICWVCRAVVDLVTKTMPVVCVLVIVDFVQVGDQS